MSKDGSGEVVTIAEHLPVRAAGVVVRRLRDEDAEAFAQGTKDPAVQQYGQLPLQHYTPEIVREQIDGVIADGLADGTLAVLAVADEGSDGFLGSIVVFDVREDRAEVGFWLAPEARGTGAASGALQAVAALAARLGLDRLDAHAAPENGGSRRVLERAGFTQQGEAHERATPSGEVIQVLTFERSLVEVRSEG